MVTFLAKVLPIAQKLRHAVMNKIKKNHNNSLKDKKVIKNQEMSEKYPKNSKFLG